MSSELRPAERKPVVVTWTRKSAGYPKAPSVTLRPNVVSWPCGLRAYEDVEGIPVHMISAAIFQDRELVKKVVESWFAAFDRITRIELIDRSGHEQKHIFTFTRKTKE